MDVIVPDGVCGDWHVETFTVSEQEAAMSRIRSWRRLEAVEAGTYKRLMRGGVVVMSNTRMEVMTNDEFVRAAHGRVLINGLGLGMVLHAILQKQSVSEAWVIENSPEVISLVAPSFSSDARVKIIHADALSYVPPRGIKFDAVWHDIWDYITADNLPDMHKLHRKYGRRSVWQGSWARDYCEQGR